jgi:hypothetical protein
MHQTAPWPTKLAQLVATVRYRPGWVFALQDINRGQGSHGLTLTINARVPDSYHPERETIVAHYMPVPPAAYDRRSWQRWLFEQCQLVDRHEACEFFEVDGVRPYAPSHGEGNDPYLVREIGTLDDQQTPAGA